MHKYKNVIILFKMQEIYKKQKSKVSSTSNGKLMIFSKCALCNSKKAKFINQQEAKGLLSKLRIKASFSKLPILGDVFF